MATRARKFTASGVVVPAGEEDEVFAVVSKGFTSVTVYNGVNNTGDPVLVLTAPGSFSLNTPVRCDKGIYVEVAGAGSGTVHL